MTSPHAAVQGNARKVSKKLPASFIAPEHVICQTFICWDVLSQCCGPRERFADGTCCAIMSLQDGGCSYASSANMPASGSMRRRLEDQEFTLRVYPGALAEGTIYCPVSARKNTTAAEAIECLIERLRLERTKCYVLAEVKEFGGEEWILNPGDCPVQRMMLWPRSALENRSGLGSGDDYRFLLREKNIDGSIHYGGSLQMWLRVTEERRRLVERGFLPQPAGSDPPSDLCALPELTERALLESLRARYRQEKIYTYIGSILIVINPFQFLPIYNPKYVKLYDNHTLGKLEPHIYAVADVAYHAMLQRRKNQCIVISGESGSGKTQSTNFLIHHLTALSQKGFASGVEQIILGAGPVLEPFCTAAHGFLSERMGTSCQHTAVHVDTMCVPCGRLYSKTGLLYAEHDIQINGLFVSSEKQLDAEKADMFLRKAAFWALDGRVSSYQGSVLCPFGYSTAFVATWPLWNTPQIQMMTASITSYYFYASHFQISIKSELFPSSSRMGLAFITCGLTIAFAFTSQGRALASYPRNTSTECEVDLMNSSQDMQRTYGQMDRVLALWNYHVFYYLLAGASEEERKSFHLLKPEEYHYLNQFFFCSFNPHDNNLPPNHHHPLPAACYYAALFPWQQQDSGVNLALTLVQRAPTVACFCVHMRLVECLVLGLCGCGFAFCACLGVYGFWSCGMSRDGGGMLFLARNRPDALTALIMIKSWIFSLLSAILHLGNIRYKKKTYRDDSIDICNPEVLPIVSELLEVKEEMLLEALTTRKTVTVGERLIVPYKLAEAGTVRDSMAKSLYSALFDWIVFRTNHALLNNKDLEDNSKEEYRAEGITWHNIEYIDNSGCLNLISKKPTALFHLLDEECKYATC
ncbi:hypothetical protein PAMP_020082 [Pampus punctatissimus]